MKMGNVGKEPRLSDLIFSIDMERQHDEVAALLDNIPPGELESSFSSIDVNLFLGEDGSCVPADFFAMDDISISSCESDEFKSLKHNIKTEPLSPREQKSMNGFNRKNCSIKKESFKEENDKEVPNENNFRRNCLKSGVEVNGDDVRENEDKTPDYTFYIAPKKKRSKKRQNPEYCKKRKSKPDTDLKIVIKRKEKLNDEPKTVENSVINHSLPTVDSPAEALTFPFGLTFDDISYSNSFSTSIAEKVKMRTRKKIGSVDSDANSLSTIEKIGDSIAEKSSVPTAIPKKDRTSRSPVAKRAKTFLSPTLKKDTTSLSPTNATYQINKPNEGIKQKLLAIKKLSRVNNVIKNPSNNVPSLSLTPSANALGITDNFICNKKTINNNYIVIASKFKNLHDYAKTMPPNNDHVEMAEVPLESDIKCFPKEGKIISWSDSNHTLTKLNTRRNSYQYIEPLLNERDCSNVVPVSMAEVEVSSFRDGADSSPDSKTPYSLRNTHFLDSSPIKPQLLTPISNKRLLSAENLRTRHCSTESENSSHGYHSAESLSPSPAQTPILFSKDRLRRSGLKSNFDSSSQSEMHDSEDKNDTYEARKPPYDNRKAKEERRIIFIGEVPLGYTEEMLQKQFCRFGEIENIQIKVREMYGFIAFKKRSDSIRAIEEGQKLWPELKVNFGGRRNFVGVTYSDLDGNFAEETEYTYGYSSPKKDDFDFARELKAAQQRRGLAYK